MELKKRVYVVLVILIILSILPIAIAQEEEISEVEKAYACLEDELGDNCGNTQSTKQNAFNLLATSYNSGLQSDCKSSLLEKRSDNCWGETDTGTCNIKSTGLATFALEHVGEDVEDYTNWLLSKRKTNTGLTWFLEVDADNETICTINGREITIKENKKISGTPPTGLSIGYYGYWFEIQDIEKNYTISCDKAFITALVFKKPGSNVFYVSSDTQSTSEHDSITEKVESYCLSSSNTCDYEGTLWAALAFTKTEEEIYPYIPYLISMSDATENKQFIPSAFLYLLTNSDDYYSELISLQKSNGYWDVSKDKFYDTAFALLALHDLTIDEVERAKRYLFSVQKESGCWQSNTAFLLHAGWPKRATVTGGGSSSIQYCDDFNYFCTSPGDCLEGEVLYNFDCDSSARVCCESEPEIQECLKKGGATCDALTEECIGEEVIASDTNKCCLGNCIEIDDENECIDSGYYCKDACSDSQEKKEGLSDACDAENFGDVCCANKPEEKSNLWLIIILLIILIILVILAIIFRNQIKVWIFKRKSGLKSQRHNGPPRPPGPGAVFPMPQQLMPRRPYPLRMPGRPPARSNPKDKEFDRFETRFTF